MNRIIRVKPQLMCEENMAMLEEKGLIIRLTPGRHRFPMAKHDGGAQAIYVSDIARGAHKLCSIVIDRLDFSAFGTHPDNEEFLLIGGVDEKTMYILVALCKKDEYMKKLESHTLTADDFICLECVFNDPNLSFFTMLKDVPHGEASKDEDKPAATFYVTEPENIGLDKMLFGDYTVEIDD